jgi:hypothetical protein
VQTQLRGQLDEVLTDVLHRSGRTARPEQLRRIVAVVDGTVVAALSDPIADPRALARGALLDVIDIVAPAI